MAKRKPTGIVKHQESIAIHGIIPRSVYRGREMLEGYSRRRAADYEAKKKREEATRERFCQSYEKCQQLLADPKIREYWLAQARTIMRKEKSWVDFPYEWPKDKGRIYAVMLITADTFSGIKILPPKLQQSAFYKAYKNVPFHIEQFDLAGEFLAYIEADLVTVGSLETSDKAEYKKTGQKKQIGHRRDRKSRKKTPVQLLKEARERQAAQEIVKKPDITIPELGEILGCHKSTIVRLKAWKKRGCLDREAKPRGWKKTAENGSDIEAIEP